MVFNKNLKERKTIITIVCDHFIPDNKAISIRMKYLAEALMNHGYAVTILTSRESKNIKGFNVKVNLVAPATNKDKLTVRLLKELLYGFENFFRVLLSRSDYYIITTPPFTIAFLAMVACALKDAKVVLDVRDEYPEVYFSEKLVSPTQLLGKILLRIERWMHDKSLLITTVTSRIALKIQKKTKQNEKVWLLRNGYADGIHPAHHALKPPFTIMFHGNMGKFQNPRLIFDLAERCHRNNLDIRFRIFGWGTNARLFQNHNIPNIEHNGEIRHEEMKKIIPKVHLGISFQKEDEISRNSFPSKIYEFIGAGVPTLVTPISEAGDFVESHKIGYQFSTDDLDGIYEKLVFLMNNPAELNCLRTNAIRIRDSLSRKDISFKFAEKLTRFLHTR
jgi:glycosyltransferase involved in cell wall biosynthesis